MFVILVNVKSAQKKISWDMFKKVLILLWDFQMIIVLDLN